MTYTVTGTVTTTVGPTTGGPTVAFSLPAAGGGESFLDLFSFPHPTNTHVKRTTAATSVGNRQIEKTHLDTK